MLKSALVTGASRGIGFAIARVLAGEGYALTVAARSARDLEAAADDLRAAGAAVLVVAADAADEEDAAALVRAHRERYGRLDVLVNNAGAAGAGAVSALAGDTLDALLAANLRSAFMVTRQSIPLLEQAGAEHGRALIVNLASIAGAYGGAGLAAYAAAKAGVIALSHSLHAELASSGVRVTALCPALVATRMTQPLGLPADELIQPDDIAEGVRFLLRTSPSCVVPAIPFIRPGDRLFASG